MRFRTKLFGAWVCLLILISGGTIWTIHRSINKSFAELDRGLFAGLGQALQGHFRDRIDRLNQACRLVINIPDLRALIAETNFELAEENNDSLTERLEYLHSVVGADFVFALNQRQMPVAQSPASPWQSLNELDGFLFDSVIAHAVLNFDSPSDDLGSEALWAIGGQLYHVAAVPMLFQSDPDVEAVPDGYLVMGVKVTDTFANELSQVHSCHVTFLANDVVAASSLPPGTDVRQLVNGNHHPNRVTNIEMGKQRYRTVCQQLFDPASRAHVATVVIQRSYAHSRIFLTALSRSIFSISALGLLLGIGFSYLLSTAITKPVKELSHGVAQVAEGRLDLNLQVRSKDELGQLAAAFNHMVSELKRSRTDLQRANEQLEHRVEERTRLLSQTNDRLKKEVTERVRAEHRADAANRAKSDFLANMSHEIRTPMTAIIGFAEQLKLTSLDDNERRQHVDTICRNSHHLMDLINDILDLSKVEAGKLDVESVPCSPAQILADVQSLMQIRAAQQGIGFEIEYATPIPDSIHSDPMRLRQILLNFVGNAIKFTRHGTVRIVASLVRNKTSERQLDDSDGKIRFDVVDSGIGMTPEQLERVFQPFTQADNTTTREYGGTGLGLTISRKLADLLGAEIEVDSDRHQGSIFSLIVPTGSLDNVSMISEPNHAVKASLAESSGETNLEKVKVLLVDDREENRHLVSSILRGAGALVTVANNGQLALDAYHHAARNSETAFDLILMDMQMPVLDGYTATRLLRESGGQTPIIALTAHAMLSDRKKCLDAGCDDHLSKPIDTAQMFSKIREQVPVKDSSDTEGNHDSQSGLPAEVNNESEKTPDGAGIPSLDLQSLRRRCLNNDDLVRSLLQRFPDRVTADLDTISAALEASDLPAVGEVAHGLKGAAANLSAITVSAACARLESAAESAAIEDVTAQLKELQQAWCELESQINLLSQVDDGRFASP